VVDDFIDRLVANAELNKNPAISQGRKSGPAPYLKFQVTQLVCEVTGGPCKYTGRGMKEAHAHLNITAKEWDVMAGDFKKSLDKYKVPAAEQKELFEIVGKTRPDIVMAKAPDRAKTVSHLKTHVTYPANKDALVSACGGTGEFTDEEQRWFADRLPAGTYKGADDVLKAVGL
jgi:hemoglobin